MSRISEKVSYERRLRLARVSPSHIFPPAVFTARAKAQSSITSLRIADRPPMRSRAVRRSRMQPPAAPAVFASRSAVHFGGYSIKKKYRNGGMSMRSAGGAAFNKNINEDRSTQNVSARETRRRKVSGV